MSDSMTDEIYQLRAENAALQAKLDEAGIELRKLHGLLATVYTIAQARTPLVLSPKIFEEMRTILFPPESKDPAENKPAELPEPLIMQVQRELLQLLRDGQRQQIRGIEDFVRNIINIRDAEKTELDRKYPQPESSNPAGEAEEAFWKWWGDPEGVAKAAEKCEEEITSKECFVAGYRAGQDADKKGEKYYAGKGAGK